MTSDCDIMVREIVGFFTSSLNSNNYQLFCKYKTGHHVITSSDSIPVSLLDQIHVVRHTCQNIWENEKSIEGPANDSVEDKGKRLIKDKGGILFRQRRLENNSYVYQCLGSLRSSYHSTRLYNN